MPADAGIQKGSAEMVKSAALLCKLDLVTNMVGEFPELQGIMGSYYAKQSKEVKNAIANHYKPKSANDTVIMDKVSASVALADKIDTLVGLFGISQIPTGDKDPFGLRRAALGIVRIILENKLSFTDGNNLFSVISKAQELFLKDDLKNQNLESELMSFIFERQLSYYKDKQIRADLFEAIYAVEKKDTLTLDSRLRLLQGFVGTPEADRLINANKRVKNILQKAEVSFKEVNTTLFREVAEQALWNAMQQPFSQNILLASSFEYNQRLLEHLMTLDVPIDDFFKDIMVMCEEPALRENRLSLLHRLRELFLQFADFSLLFSSTNS
jgi:glycyl-tRNA synthetase beta chain